MPDTISTKHRSKMKFHYMVMIILLVQFILLIVKMKHETLLDVSQVNITTALMRNSQPWNQYRVLFDFSFQRPHNQPNKKNSQRKKLDVTLVTQCSISNFHYLLEMRQRWKGPMSVAVFSPGKEFWHAVIVVHLITICFPNTDVSFHLVFPSHHSPQVLDQYADIWNTMFDDVMTGCEQLSTALRSLKLTSKKNYDRVEITYPHNTLRNVAKQGVYTTHMFLLDIDVMPSANLRDSFLRFVTFNKFDVSHLNILSEPSVFVVPVFEIESFATMPCTKSELIQAIKSQEARIFHTQTCPMCHRSTR